MSEFRIDDGNIYNFQEETYIHYDDRGDHIGPDIAYDLAHQIASEAIAKHELIDEEYYAPLQREIAKTIRKVFHKDDPFRKLNT